MKGIVREMERLVGGALRKGGVRSVVAAVSGGADSTALLCAMERIRHSMGVRLECVNCNFHLRGEESERDSRFVADLCEKLGIKLHRFDFDVEEHMRVNPGKSLEMACRDLRYADFYRLKEELGFDRIAVAHNADDDIETLLMAMLRGSGVRGLKGMEIDNGTIIRPLLRTSRKEIEGYLKSIGQDFVTDSSNLTSDFRRNFLRREVIPLMETRWPGARKGMGKTVEILKEEDEILRRHYAEKLGELCVGPNMLDAYSEKASIGVILRFIEPFGGNPAMAGEIKEATSRPFESRKWNLNEGWTAVLERDRLIVRNTEEDSEGDVSFVWSEMEMSEETMRIVKGNKNHNVVYLPEPKDHYVLRTPMTGDRIRPLGMKGSRLVSDVIKDARIDTCAKSRVRVLVRKTDGEVIWVSGLKRSRHGLVRPDGGKIYRLEGSTHFH